MVSRVNILSRDVMDRFRFACRLVQEGRRMRCRFENSQRCEDAPFLYSGLINRGGNIKRKSFLPDYGSVGIMCITDKQFGNIALFYGKRLWMNTFLDKITIIPKKSRANGGILNSILFLYSNTMCNRLNIRLLLVISCFQWFKDTKMKANHNFCSAVHHARCAVSNGSKILK